MKRLFIIISWFCCAAFLNAQVQQLGEIYLPSKDTIKPTSADFMYLGPIYIVNGLVTNTKSTSLNLSLISGKGLLMTPAYNLSDALTIIPGVSQLTTGIGISKPVIRGLYGNRIMVLLSGMRFDNQQWQDEHGLGLSQLGIDNIELLKGASSLIYGSEAIGGTLNIIEESANFAKNKRSFDAGTKFFSNTRGILFDFGTQHAWSKNSILKWNTMRLGIENHADYADGKNQRVLNTRNKGLLFKFGWGKSKGQFQQENRYMFSYNQYGFVMDGLNDFFKPDARNSRELIGPHHNVMLNTFSSQNRFFRKKYNLFFNVGAQSNSRMEDEGGGQISLNMHLWSLLQNMQIIIPQIFLKNTSFQINQQFTYSNNKNYGGRVIVPDANMLESNLGALVKTKLGNLYLDGGFGLALKSFQTYQTRTLNSPGERIQPFGKTAIASNASVGFAYNGILINKYEIKGNFSTGFRPGNLAELSCNGLHEGSIRYELGNPNLKNETNFTGDLNFKTFGKWMKFNFSAYANHFSNYIYLAPTADSFYGYQVFKYSQTNAQIMGAEAVFTVAIVPEKIEWSNTFSQITGTKSEGTSKYLPFISPSKFVSSLSLELASKLNLRIEGVFAGAQLKTAEYETTTNAYKLLNLYIDYGFGKHKFAFSVKNMMNTSYYDHLSRLKAYNLYNQGRNFVVTYRVEF